jgi:5-methylcytosine-specific restriction endonuclease McrBC GTP-binding regulatory subunit McrB
MDVMEEGEGEDAGGGQGAAPGASATGVGGRMKSTAASMAGSVLSLTAANMKNTAASMKNTAAMAGSVLSQAQRRRRSSVTQEANTTQTKTSGAADLFTEQERQDAKLWVVQAKKLEEALGPCMKKLDKLKAAAKKEKVQATKEIKALEKLVTAAAKKDAKVRGEYGFMKLMK